MTAKHTVACEIYDVAEAACVRGLEVRLTTTDGQAIVGKAIDIQATDDAEFLVMRAPGRKLLVRLRAVESIDLGAAA